MRSPAAAIAWAFRQRHRWGLSALAGYLLVVTTIKLVILARGQLVDIGSDEQFAVLVIVPLTATLLYCLTVFTFGLSGDIGARQSMYPARMFTLPVTTAALVGWPMLYGTIVITILWFATRSFTLWPSGFDIPIIWPALLAASLLAWTQALTWMPYGLPGVRAIVVVFWLAAVDSVVLLALHFKARETVMLALLAPHVPLAYLVARAAVARARRGDVPDWRPMFARAGAIASVRPGERTRFASPARAQAWLEWRQHGRSLPVLVGILLPFELALLFLVRKATPALAWYTLFGVLLTPPFMAAFVAATVRKPGPETRDAYGVAPFIATRPLTTAALIAAKLNATVWSTLAAWLLVLVAVPLALTLSDTAPLVMERASRLAEIMGTPRAFVLVLLALAGAMAWTWKQLVQSLYIGLSGREWVAKGSIFLALAILTAIGPVAKWIHDSRDVRAALWGALPSILGVLVCIKMSAAAWIAVRLYRSRALSDRTLVTGAACWALAVLALHGVLVWLFSTLIIPGYLLGVVAILAVPLARLSAAPLALAWNRHR